MFKIIKPQTNLYKFFTLRSIRLCKVVSKAFNIHCLGSDLALKQNLDFILLTQLDTWVRSEFISWNNAVCELEILI